MAEVFYFHVQEDRSIKYKLTEPIMQEDKDVAVWRFRIPKVLNNIDMSAWAWWFVYVNAKNQKFSELLTLTNDIDDPENYCTADYPIGYGISKTPGGFTFALEAINANQGGEIDGEWHTRTYSHAVTPTLQGNQTEYTETESDIISALMQEVRNKVNQLVGGATPLPVNLKSLMTDHDKVYLYTGSETGESTGYWYYYNGSNFVPGGLYGAGVQIDSTLSQSGQAADAGAVRVALAGKVAKPLTSPDGTNGQLLRTLGNGQTEWTDFATPTTEQVGVAVEDWLDAHPEATTTIIDGTVSEAKLKDGAVTGAKIANGAVTENKLSARLNILTSVNLNGITYSENIILPIAKSYAEAVTYLDGYYYAACRDYSASPNTCYVAKYDTSYNLIDTVYISATYGMANNIFNDGEQIYIDFDSGYHVSFDDSISDNFAVQNSNIRNMAFWDDTLYGIAINASDVTVYTVASDFTTISEVFSVVTIRQTLQSASIIDGILFISTTKGLFKFIDMEKQAMIAEIPYYDSKEIENFFKDKDGTVKCSGHFYGANGVLNIGAFNGGADGTKMQYSDINGSNGDYSTFAKSSHRYGFYKISNGIAMGLPADTGDLLLFEDARLFVSKTSNAIYTYSNNAWNLVSFLSETILYKKVNNTYIYFKLTTDGHFVIYSDQFFITSSTTVIDIDLSDIYTALGLADGKTFTRYVIGTSSTMNIARNTNEVYATQIYVGKTSTQLFTRNVTKNSVSDSDIDARIEFYVTLK